MNKQQWGCKWHICVIFLFKWHISQSILWNSCLPELRESLCNQQYKYDWSTQSFKAKILLHHYITYVRKCLRNTALCTLKYTYPYNSEWWHFAFQEHYSQCYTENKKYNNGM